MANENWEEISEWDIEEDIDLAQRITVHAIHSIDDEEEYQLVQAYKHPTYAAAAKWGSRKSSSSNDEKASKDNKTSSEKKKSTSPKDEKDEEDNKTSSKDTILKGDHDIDYDTSDFTSAPSEAKKEARRTNTKLHKIQSQKLMTSLLPDGELDNNLVKGDTNRDPEYKHYKLLKKSMKKHNRSKNDRKTSKNLEELQRLRVQVW